jgi:hypothetical protein
MMHLLGEDVLNRTVQHRVLLLLSLLVAVLGVLGLYTLCASPILSLGVAGSSLLTATDLQSIAHIPLDPTFFRSLPEFFTPTAEAHWWQQQEQIYTLLQQEPCVAVEWLGKDGVLRMGQAHVGRLPLLEAINRTWLLSLVALIYLTSGL